MIYIYISVICFFYFYSYIFLYDMCDMYFGLSPFPVIVTRIISCLGSGIPINLHLVGDSYTQEVQVNQTLPHGRFLGILIPWILLSKPATLFGGWTSREFI